MANVKSTALVTSALQAELAALLQSGALTEDQVNAIASRVATTVAAAANPPKVVLTEEVKAERVLAYEERLSAYEALVTDFRAAHEALRLSVVDLCEAGIQAGYKYPSYGDSINDEDTTAMTAETRAPRGAVENRAPRGVMPYRVAVQLQNFEVGSIIKTSSFIEGAKISSFGSMKERLTSAGVIEACVEEGKKRSSSFRLVRLPSAEELYKLLFSRDGVTFEQAAEASASYSEDAE